MAPNDRQRTVFTRRRMGETRGAMANAIESVRRRPTMRALGFKRIGQFDLTALDTSGDPPPDVLLPDAPLGDVIVPPGLTIPTSPGGAGTPGPTSFRPATWDQTPPPAEYLSAPVAT